MPAVNGQTPWIGANDLVNGENVNNGAHHQPRATMNYQFEFGAVFDAWRELAYGALNTLMLSGAAMAIGLVVAVLGALAQSSGAKWLRFLVKAYIEIIRNTPFPIQLFMIYPP